MDDARDFSRREFLRASKRWSGAVVGLVIAGGMAPDNASAQGVWVNSYGGGWVNHVGWANGGGVWVNRAGGGWLNSIAWANRGGGWANRAGWINGSGGWTNRGGSWGNGSAGSWVNRYGGGGWVNRR